LTVRSLENLWLFALWNTKNELNWLCWRKVVCVSVKYWWKDFLYLIDIVICYRSCGPWGFFPPLFSLRLYIVIVVWTEIQHFPWLSHLFRDFLLKNFQRLKDWRRNSFCFVCKLLSNGLCLEGLMRNAKSTWTNLRDKDSLPCIVLRKKYIVFLPFVWVKDTAHVEILFWA